jgi:hypothetical protein
MEIRKRKNVTITLTSKREVEVMADLFGNQKSIGAAIDETGWWEFSSRNKAQELMSFDNYKKLSVILKTWKK